MRKFITLLLLGIPLLMFTSCDDEVIINPAVTAAQMEQAYAADTLQYLVVETENSTLYYNVSNDRLEPEVKILKDSGSKGFMIVFVAGIFLMIGIGIGSALND